MRITHIILLACRECTATGRGIWLQCLALTILRKAIEAIILIHIWILVSGDIDKTSVILPFAVKLYIRMCNAFINK